jgi:hypothetical protein
MCPMPTFAASPWPSRLSWRLVAAKSTAERQQALRKRREALGLTRLELYIHPDDHHPVKLYADLLQQDRALKRDTNKEKK